MTEPEDIARLHYRQAAAQMEAGAREVARLNRQHWGGLIWAAWWESVAAFWQGQKEKADD